MKTSWLFGAALVFVFALGACDDGDDDIAFQIGLVTDVGGIDDRSFNQGAWEGILEFAEEYDLPEGNYRYLESASEAEYLPNIIALSDDEPDLIVVPGSLFEDALIDAAARYPDQGYLIIDKAIAADNVASAVFAAHEGSFLVGVAAALEAQAAGEDTVGFIGGMDIDIIQEFEAGFEAGVWAVDPAMTVLVDYVGSFSDAQAGQTVAAGQYDRGAHVVYHAAGGAGNGVISEARDRQADGEEAWVIGVDRDQYEDGVYNEAGDSAVLTSMMKHVDVAAYLVAVAAHDGDFPGGGTLVFDLANDGVGLPAENPNLTQAMIDAVAGYEQDILDGVITVPTVPSRLS